MATMDLDWLAQLKACRDRIAELEEKIATQRQKIRRFSDQKMNIKWAQYLLAMRQESLERAESRKNLIESRIADHVANQHDAAESNAMALSLTNANVAAQPQRLQSGNGLSEVAAGGRHPDRTGRWGGGNLDVEVGQRHSGRRRDAFAAHDVQCVLGGEQQDTTGTWHGEAAQTRDDGGERDGEVQRQEQLAALWLAANDADRLLGS
jgi:hypothetical protein